MCFEQNLKICSRFSRVLFREKFALHFSFLDNHCPKKTFFVSDVSRVRRRKWKLHFIFLGIVFCFEERSRDLLQVVSTHKWEPVLIAICCWLAQKGSKRVVQTRPDTRQTIFFLCRSIVVRCVVARFSTTLRLCEKKINTIKKEICEVCRACRRTRKSYRDCEHRRDTRRVIIKFNVKNIARHSSQRRLVSETEKSDDVVDVENK